MSETTEKIILAVCSTVIVIVGGFSLLTYAYEVGETTVCGRLHGQWDDKNGVCVLEEPKR